MMNPAGRFKTPEAVLQDASLGDDQKIEILRRLVEQGNTDKVGLLIAEARRMGIEVLPPRLPESSRRG